MKADSASTPDRVVVPFLPTREARARLLRRERLKSPRRRVREKIVAALELLEKVREDLIMRLDLIDGDPDLELDDSELEENGDLEPNLGSMSNRSNQRFWALGAGYDGDAEHDGREPQCEDEGAQ